MTLTDLGLWQVHNRKAGASERHEGGATGPALIRELLSSGLHISASSDHQTSLDKDLKQLLEYSSRYPFPSAPQAGSSVESTIHEPTPLLAVPAFVNAIIARQIKKTKGGRVIVDGPVTFDRFGSLVTDMVSQATYPRKEHARDMALDFDALIGAISDNILDLMRIVDRKEMVMINFLMANLVPEGLSKVRVAPSSIHGNGVFAEHRINAGDLITVYPCDVLAIDNPGGGMRLYRSNGDAILRAEAAVLYAYLCKVEGTKLAVAGDPDTHSPAACAHIINDGAFLEKADFSLEEAKAYMEESYVKQNCHFVSLADCCMVAVATKPIKKDEEVFAGYGAEFWGECARRNM
mgnify:CR=1 FL=1